MIEPGQPVLPCAMSVTPSLSERPPIPRIQDKRSVPHLAFVPEPEPSPAAPETNEDAERGVLVAHFLFFHSRPGVSILAWYRPVAVQSGGSFSVNASTLYQSRACAIPHSVLVCVARRDLDYVAL